ncbi:MAG: ABC transporter permease [Hyphomonadaceae bacterium]
MNSRAALLLRLAYANVSARPQQTALAVFGVAVGVCCFLAVSAMMLGSQADLLRTLTESAPHIVVSDEERGTRAQPAVDRFENAAIDVHGLRAREEIRGLRAWTAMLSDVRREPGVIAAPVLSGAVTVRFGGRTEPLTLQGVDPRLERDIINIDEMLIGGSLSDLEAVDDAVILSEQAAQRLGARLGDIVTLRSPAGVSQRARVIALFNGNDRLGSGRIAYSLLRNAQVLLARPGIVNAVHVRLADAATAPDVARRLEQRWGYRWESWQERSRKITTALMVHNIVTYAVISAVLLVASFGVYSLVSTNVMEKRREIAILRAIGVGADEVSAMFVLAGVVLGAFGAIAGALIGAAVIAATGSAAVTVGGGDHRIPMSNTLALYGLAMAAALLTAALASWLPARRAAKQDPVDTLRGAT